MIIIDWETDTLCEALRVTHSEKYNPVTRLYRVDTAYRLLVMGITLNCGVPKNVFCAESCLMTLNELTQIDQGLLRAWKFYGIINRTTSMGAQ